MGDLLQDVRFAFRQLRSSPAFAITAVLSIILGIGATTAIFSVVYGVLVDPYPYRDADRMVHVELRQKGDRGPLLVVNGTEYPELRKAATIDDVFLQKDETQTMTGNELPVSVQVGMYSPNLFEYMGVPPFLGRAFTSADAPGGSPAPVAVLSYLFWQRQFGGSREAIGKTIEVNHKLYTVIGIARPRFTWGDSDVYLPAVPSANAHDYWLSFLKLKPGTKHPAAAAELQVLLDRFTKDDSKDFRRDRKVVIVTLNEEVLGRFAGTLVLLFGAVVALLVIGCANVSILLLARGTARQHELSVRVAVGAGRARLIRQLLTESVLLSVAGAALGVLAAYQGAKAISAMVPYYSFPHEAAIRVSTPVLLFSAAVALITGILFGISPALQLSRPQLGQLIQASSGKHSGSARGRNVHRLLIAGQPGVSSASVSTTWFPGLGGFEGKIELQSKPTLTDAQAMLALVSPYEFPTLRIPVLAGRVYNDAEVMRAAHLALVNQAFVKQYLGGGDPIGQRIRSPMLRVEQPSLLLAQAPDDWMEVIGVVGDARNNGLSRPIKPAVFIPYSFVLPPDESLLVRATGDPDAAIRSVKRRLREVNAEIVVSQERTVLWWLDTQGWGRERFIATLFGLFAGLALVLAATGLYSVVSFAVTQRTQELGIRMALGAPRNSVIRLVLRSTAATLGVGIAVGIGLSVMLSRLITSWAGGSPRDPLTLLGAALGLAVVATLACILPAWRAASIDPMRALRTE